MRLAFACIVLAAFVLSNCSSDDGARQAPRDPKDASTDTGGRGGSGGSTAGSSGTGGSGGSGGSAGADGSGGSGGTAGSTGGTAGSSAGSSGTGGTAVDASADSGDAAVDSGDAAADSADAAACGLGDPCCNGTCTSSYQCLGERCGCIRAIQGEHYLRTDGRVYDYSAGTPLVIEQGSTGLPLENATEIFEGDEHGCALKTDGSVWCWALNTTGNGAGQLGNGVIGGATVARRANPVLLAAADSGAAAPLAGAIRLNSGSSRSYLASTTCAILGNGTVWCWGSLGNGGGTPNIFNDGVAGNRPYAVQILANASTPLTGVSHVGLGRRHACVLRSGEVWCWASNVYGALGIGDLPTQVYPTRVTLPGLAHQIGVGSDSTCARVSDAVYCWGANANGQLGIGVPTTEPGCSSACTRLPTRVIDAQSNPLTGVVDLNVAYHTACALLTDHSLHCWGAGTTNHASPLNVGGMPVTNVLFHTTVGSAGFPGAIRTLTRDNVLKRVNSVVNQVCQ